MSRARLAAAVVLALAAPACNRAPAPRSDGEREKVKSVSPSDEKVKPVSLSHEKAKPVSLSSPRVAEVITAAGDVRDALPLDGALWLATSGGILRASGELVEEARFTTLDGLPSNDVWALAADGGALFAATSAGVVRARVENGRLAAIETLGLPRARSLAIADGVLYAGSWGGGIARLDGGRMQELAFGAGAQVTRLRASGGRLWVATAGMGILRVDLCAGRGCSPKTRWITRRDGLNDDVVWDVLPSPSGDGALAATVAGLAAIDGDRATPLAPRGDLRALGVLDGKTLAGRNGDGLVRDGAPLGGDVKRARAIVALGRGALVCGEDGAALLWPDGSVRATLHPVGLPSPDVTALALDGDTLYAGTFDRGVVRVRRAGDALEIARVDGAIDDRVNALATRPGELWIGTARGATRIRAGAATHFTVAEGLPDDHVNALLAEPDGVWLATTRGLARVDGEPPAGYARITADQRAANGLLEITVENGLPATRLSSLARGADGALWVGTAHGVARLARGEWTLARAHQGALPDDFVTALVVDGEALWAGTYSSGLARRDAAGAWTLLRERDGLPSNWVNPGALAAWSGRLFVGSNDRGLAVRGDAWSSLGVDGGLPSADVTAFAPTESELWVGTRGGLARVVMSKLEARR